MVNFFKKGRFDTGDLLIVILIIIIIGFIGIKLFPSSCDKPLYTGEMDSFIVNDVNIFAWSNLEGVCYQSLSERRQLVNSPYEVCFISRSGNGVNSLVSYNVACGCYGTNYNVRK